MSEQIVTTEKGALIYLHKQPGLQEIQVRTGVILRLMENQDAPAIITVINAESIAVQHHLGLEPSEITCKEPDNGWAERLL